MADTTGLIEWPDFLPYPQREGYKSSEVDKHIKADVPKGVGNLYYEPDVNKNLEVFFILDQMQKDLFESWFDHELKQGARWFNCPLVDNVGNVVSKQPARKSPQSGKEITILSGGMDYKVKLKLQLYPMPTLSAAGLVWIPYFGGIEQFAQNADLFHQLINFTAPTALQVPEI